MKVEKISENQIKLTLTSSDLKENNIRLDDLTKPNEKAQELFKKIMEKAFTQCGFEVDDTPLMVEATPISLDGLMIIVTKLPEKASPKDSLSLISQNKELRRYKKKNIEHIKRLNSMRLYGAITGKAIYAKTLDLNEAWKICKEG